MAADLEAAMEHLKGKVPVFHDEAAAQYAFDAVANTSTRFEFTDTQQSNRKYFRVKLREEGSDYTSFSIDDTSDYIQLEEYTYVSHRGTHYLDIPFRTEDSFTRVKLLIKYLEKLDVDRGGEILNGKYRIKFEVPDRLRPVMIPNEHDNPITSIFLMRMGFEYATDSLGRPYFYTIYRLKDTYTLLNQLDSPPTYRRGPTPIKTIVLQLMKGIPSIEEMVARSGFLRKKRSRAKKQKTKIKTHKNKTKNQIII
jgi:hypothetical protein